VFRNVQFHAQDAPKSVWHTDSAQTHWEVTVFPKLLSWIYGEGTQGWEEKEEDGKVMGQGKGVGWKGQDSQGGR